MRYSFGLSAVAILWALTAKAPRPLRFYFGAQIVYCAIIYLAFADLAKGWIRPIDYFVAYCGGLALVAYAMAKIVWESKKGWGAFLFSLGLSLTFTIAAYFGIRQLDAGALSGLVEGGILTFCGAALALSIPRSKSPKVSAALVYLWLVLAFFDYAYAMAISGTEILNLWFRTFAVIVAMLYLGHKLRKVPAA